MFVSLAQLPCAYQVIVLQDHVVRLSLSADAQQANHIRVVQLAEHFSFTSEVALQLLVSGLQTLHQNHRLSVTFFNAFSFGQ